MYRLFLFVLAAVLLTLAAPMFIPMIIISLLIILDDGGNPVYLDKRVGRKGKYISIVKFRSMVMNAGDLEELLTAEQYEQYKKEFKLEDDPRITNIGTFIRETSLDEILQFFNILKGDMSLIGP